jgi:hypothetical protein
METRLVLTVKHPDNDSPEQVAEALQAALDSAPGEWDDSQPYWGDWEVSKLMIDR